ncbi:MAG: hypothetical protein EZS28_023760, partial [Streblomastix strix]
MITVLTMIRIKVMVGILFIQLHSYCVQMKTLTFRRPSPNPLWCYPLDLSPMYLNAQLLQAQKSQCELNYYQVKFVVNSGGYIGVNQLQSVLCELSLFHNGYQSSKILLVRAIPGESINLPFTYLGSQTCNSEFQLWKLDQKVGWPAELGAGGVNKLDYQ